VVRRGLILRHYARAGPGEGQRDHSVRYASPKRAPTASATPGDWTEASGGRTQLSVVPATAPGRVPKSQEFHRWNRPITTPIAHRPAETTTAIHPLTAPNPP